MDDRLGVGSGCIPMAERLQPLAKNRMVIDFSVEDNPERTVFVADGLMPGRQINDAQPAHAEPGAAFHVNALVVGPAMNHGGTHLPQDPGVDFRVFRELHYSSDSAHGTSLPEPEI
jgi:hypothetical protein